MGATCPRGCRRICTQLATMKVKINNAAGEVVLDASRTMFVASLKALYIRTLRCALLAAPCHPAALQPADAHVHPLARSHAPLCRAD
ncbi:hypothetical protein EON67_08560, partial [archaeon]